MNEATLAALKLTEEVPETEVKKLPQEEKVVEEKKVEEAPVVVKEQETKTEEPEATTTDDSETVDPKLEEERKENRADRKYHKLLKERAEARAEVKVLREQLERAQSGTEQTATQKPKNVEGKPQRDQFATFEEFDTAREAWTDWRIQQAEESGKRAATVDRENQEITKKISDFKTSHKDYDQVLMTAEEEGMTASNAVTAMIRDESNPASLIYHFAKNPELLESLNKMPEWKAAKEIGRISVKLETESTPVTKVAPKVSKAPEPVSELPAGSRAKEKTLSEMDDDEVAAYHKQRYRQKIGYK